MHMGMVCSRPNTTKDLSTLILQVEALISDMTWELWERMVGRPCHRSEAAEVRLGEVPGRLCHDPDIRRH